MKYRRHPTRSGAKGTLLLLAAGLLLAVPAYAQRHGGPGGAGRPPAGYERQPSLPPAAQQGRSDMTSAGPQRAYAPYGYPGPGPSPEPRGPQGSYPAQPGSYAGRPYSQQMGPERLAPGAGSTPPPGTIRQSPAPPQSTINGIQRRLAPGAVPQKGENLATWMNRHSNMSPQQQQQALEREPGFHDLPANTQQRYRDRLQQLDNMPPQERSRMIDRTQAMARLSPQQRADIRGAMAPLANMQPDRKRAVSRAFRNLRSLPPGQRQAYMNSPEFRSQFTDSERGTLQGLMNVEPMIPRTE